MSDNDMDAFEVLEDVNAETVTINQGGAQSIEAESVDITQGGAQVIEAKDVAITPGGALFLEAHNAEFTMGGAGFVTADNADLNQAGAGIVIADTLKAEENTTIAMLFAGEIEGTPTVRADARKLAAFGAAAGLTYFLLRKIFGK